MKILHINQWDTRGGSARASLRIHTAMLQQGIDSHLMVSDLTGQRLDPVPAVSRIAGERLLRWGDGVTRALMHAASLEDRFYPSTSLLSHRTRFRQSDIVQLYSTHGGYFAFPALPALSRAKPVFWRLSDVWPMTGHCTYPGPCERWRTGCGRCPVFLEYPPGLWCDTTAAAWRRKKSLYERSKLVFVAPSTWIRELAQQSPLIGRFPILHVPNGVETGVFMPLDQAWARVMWNLPLRAKIVLATTSLYGDRRKGATLADELLGRIRALAGGAMDLHVLFVGRRHKPFEERLVRLLPFTPTGYVEEPRLLATIYSAADVVLHPALEENLANSVMEGMACGTPAACFDAGGMRDVVVDGQTGALAPRGDVEALAQRVVGILAADPNQAAQRRAACSERIRRGFSADKESRLLMQAYEEALHARASA